MESFKAHPDISFSIITEFLFNNKHGIIGGKSAHFGNTNQDLYTGATCGSLGDSGGSAWVQGPIQYG